ncbi:hypothetical protein ACIOJD_32655 [Streptomyces sp. NPDC088116]|uniref:hypothetical protein n=1 Tax=Streptomyces sp. NPDC088116 TaxID=3365825 RepID=UPI00380B77D5
MEQLADAGNVVPTSPVAAIVIAWNTVRRLAEEVLPVSFVGPASDRQRNLIHEMERMDMPPESLELFRELGRLHDRATQGDELATKKAALDFVNAAWSLCRQIHPPRHAAA